MNKKERLEKIRRFVSDYEVGTQEAIVEYLKQSGITATQATISRDIKELGIVKIPQKDNTYIYELPKSASTSLKLADNNILDFELLRNMINLRLVPGSTAFVKRQIVEDFSDDIFSILADDDTILLIFRNEEMAHKVLEEIKNW
ncbi:MULTISPECIES: arginine repressor [unclassified Streptococcus]|uniref:arginine repressor n=1 Tax=unclassified Streptococcus TaxID=2608887 RepID=UPI0007355B50|nr:MULTISPECIES: arginine repressor [unclassified Streptococcus]OFN57117.1 arginine repressor [Streptococcus sp. HMSC034B05]PNM83566.1 arginine repressor [Streptococcus sp. FDAARGOS_146]